MDHKLMESYLDYIAGKVVDEDNIVTYKSLSRNLNIHVNTAKQLLYTYVTNEKLKNTFPISATYLIAGKVIDGSFNISVVNESDLKSAQSKLIQVTSEHVYSVQKGISLKDIKCLCGVDKESTSNSSNPVIKYFKNVLKEKEVKKKSQFDDADNKRIIKQALVSSKETAVTELNKKSQSAETSHCKKTSPKENAEKAETTVKKPTGNIANLFAKALIKNSEKSLKADSFKKEPKSVTNVADDEEMIDEKSSEGETSKKRNNSTESLKRNKRRRILMESDSEESNDEEERVEINLEDEQSPPMIRSIEEIEESKELFSKNKRKKRKVIDKTVMNEDGYLETKKEIVFETDSENEVEDVTKPVEEKKPKADKGKGAQGCKKQSSLLSFFKKG